MKIDIANLPDDVKTLKEIIIYQYQMINALQEQINVLKAALFGPSAEKIKTKEAAAPGEEVAGVFDEAEQEEPVEVGGYIRGKGGRKALPAHLPRIDIVHELEEKERVHGCGLMMKEIGEEVSEKLRVIPQQMFVEVHHRKKYACECEGVGTEGDEGAVRIAPAEVSMIPQSIATPSLLAYILTNKFCDALPFYRQEKIFERHGIELPRQTMSYWAIKVYERIAPLLQRMKEHLQGGPVIGMDETPVQVLGEEGRENTTKSYMWVSYGGSGEKRVIVYRYYPGRSADFLNEYLDDYTGYLQCDGYPAYSAHQKRSGTSIIVVGCWAHVRRKYFEVTKATKESRLAKEALDKIRALYTIESRARIENLSADEITALRQEQSKQIVEDFKSFVDKHAPDVPPKSTLGKAFSYTLNEWPKLTAFLEDGRVPIDNNRVENAIRPFVLGRKNWLFSGSPRGADASAALYSIIETAKANGLEPFHYLLHLFENLPKAQSPSDFDALLPFNIDKSLIKSLSS